MLSASAVVPPLAEGWWLSRPATMALSLRRQMTSGNAARSVIGCSELVEGYTPTPTRSLTGYAAQGMLVLLSVRSSALEVTSVMASSSVQRSSWDADRTLILSAFLCVGVGAPLIVVGDRWLSHAALLWQLPMALVVLTPGAWFGDWRLQSFLLVLTGGLSYRLQRPRLTAAALCALAALHLSGLFTRLLKHTLCRSRPLLLEAGTFHPSLCFQEGLDSFPSGHATHAFAIAVILAAACPRLAPLCYGLAAWIALSRVVFGGPITPLMCWWELPWASCGGPSAGASFTAWLWLGTRSGRHLGMLPTPRDRPGALCEACRANPADPGATAGVRPSH